MKLVLIELKTIIFFASRTRRDAYRRQSADINHDIEENFEASTKKYCSLFKDFQRKKCKKNDELFFFFDET